MCLAKTGINLYMYRVWSEFTGPSMGSQGLKLSSSWDWRMIRLHGSDGWSESSLHTKMSRLMTKPTKWPLRPAKTQISLGIRPVWSESSLSAWRTTGSSATHWVHCEDSDQTGQMPRLIWVFAVRTDHFVGFVKRRPKYSCPFNYTSTQL